MRISALANDPGFDLYQQAKDDGQTPRIFLNGIELRHVITADDVERSVERFVVRDDGRPVIAPSGDRLETETLYGRVDIVLAG